jgi:hypothetical protein
MCQLTQTFVAPTLIVANGVDLCLREVIEPPVSLVDCDSERLAISTMMIFSKLSDRDNFFVISNHVKQPD